MKTGSGIAKTMSPRAEKAMLVREEAVSSREAALQHTATWFAPAVWLYRQLRHIRDAVGGLPQSAAHDQATLAASTTPAAGTGGPEVAPGPVINGYPAFGSPHCCLQGPCFLIPLGQYPSRRRAFLFQVTHV